MRTDPSNQGSFGFREVIFDFSRRVVLTFWVCAPAIWPGPWVQAQTSYEYPAGVAWRVQGSWDGYGSTQPIRAGEAIFPGALLRPSGEGGTHSIIVLLPDGQRILYECFTRTQCQRGFRVPDLYSKPDSFAVSMLARVRASLSRVSKNSTVRLPDGSELPRDEAVADLGPGDHVKVGGLASSLPNGDYTYELRSLASGHAAELRRDFKKKRSYITLSVPAAGLYDATIFDKLHRPRIDLFLVAARPNLASQLTKDLNRANALLSEWNDNYQGWPIHEFQRAYLESLVLGVSDSPAYSEHSLRDSPPEADVTDEPTFSPQPGVFDGNTKVELLCKTPGAVIHFTVDSSQPVEDSLVYKAPVVVKGTELTIKAFASAPGKKDSPVVTGIFRIRD
jgi:hypothetical protein